MKKIYAFWWYEKNFGDALNPFLLERLSDKKVVFCNEHRPFFREELKRIIKCISTHTKYDFRRLLWPDNKKTIIMAVGSMLRFSHPNYVVWGAGFMHKYDHFNGGKILAVRGPFSAKKLEGMGYPLCTVYGDPALLLPLIYNPEIDKNKKGIGIIPHYIEYEDFKNKYPNKRMINLATYDIMSVIKWICESSYIISTSLHGVIVAHAYGIPALWIKVGDIATDGIKFNDYFSSVGIPLYNGNFDFEKLITMNYSDYPDDIKSLMLPDANIVKEIQRDLISVAPFPVQKKYKDIIISQDLYK